MQSITQITNIACKRNTGTVDFNLDIATYAKVVGFQLDIKSVVYRIW